MPEDFGALRVVDLKEECKKRNLTVGGKKAELISRLEEFEASKDDTSAATAKEPTGASEQDYALPSGAPEDAEAAAEEILKADKPSSQDDAEAAIGHKQAEPTPAEEQAPDTEVHKTRSKGEVASADADATAQEIFAEAEAAGKAEAENENVEDEAAGSKTAKPLQPESQSGTATSEKASTVAATDTMPAAHLESQVPAVKTAAPAADEAAVMKPATEVPTATAGTDPATAQLDTPKQTQLAPTGAAAMDIDSEQPLQTLSEGPNKQATTAPAADKKSHAEADTAADKAAADAVPLVAALTDAGMGDAAAGEDAEMVQYDAQSDDEQVAPTKDKKQADVKVTKDNKAQRREAPSTSKAVKSEATPHASARKRGREADEPARDDRKAPRTEHRSDVRLSQREKDKEREREKKKDRDRAKDSKQANGDPPSGTDRRRKHAPISYKPPERTDSQTDRSRVPDFSRRDARSDRRPSDAEGAQDLVSRKSDLERAVSRTESGHKLSVFERLQRGKGEGGSGSAAPPSTGRDPIPTPAAAKSKEALPRTSSHSRRNQPTQALRIDGFVRPLTVQKTQAMLSEFGDIQKLWMPSIRTHAFVVFASAEQAEKCHKATAGLNWPQGNLGSTLSPKYVTVEEAELAIARAGGGPAPAGAPASTANGSAAGLPAAALDAAPAAGQANERRAVPEERRRDPDDRQRARHDDVSDRRRVTADARSADAAPAPQVDNPPTLDELFRKTTTKPCLYWLPLTEVQAAERKAKLEAASAQKVQASDAAVPLSVT